jgi:hypothetical protein
MLVTLPGDQWQDYMARWNNLCIRSVSTTLLALVKSMLERQWISLLKGLACMYIRKQSRGDSEEGWKNHVTP